MADGTIDEKKLEYDGNMASIPASNIPKGKSGLVHIWGRNNTAQAQRMGIAWAVIDPDGVARENYGVWEAWPYTGAGSRHEFIGGRFSIDKVGTWRINAYLYMYSTYPTVLDKYEGTLCVVPLTLYTLKTLITPVGKGYVETTPNPQAGYQKWVDGSTGQFPEGTKVQVKATPYSGYRFEKWSTDIVGGVSTQNPEYVQDMTQSRTVKCHFREEEQPSLEKLEVDIVGGKGHVVTDPASQEGKTIWYGDETGNFLYGTNVKVTAVPDAGYVFDHWSADIVGGTSTKNPDYVQTMTQNRNVKCHFREEEKPSLETLIVNITPSGTGYVMTDPASQEGKTKWNDGEQGNFLYGTNVKVTAYPNEGYAFEKWSTDIVGGVSYDNPAYIQTMTQNRSVKCHFVKEPSDGADEPGKGEITSITIDWQDKTGLTPPADVENKGTYEIHPICKNTSSSVLQFKVVATVTKPSGAVVTKSDIDGWPHTGAGKEFKPTLNMGDVDEVGTWTAVITLYNNETGGTLDSWSGDLLKVSQAAGAIDFSSIMGIMVMVMMMGMITPMMEEE